MSKALNCVLVAGIALATLTACNNDPYEFYPELRPTTEPTSIVQPAPTTVGECENLCSNPYWPIWEGATWNFEVTADDLVGIDGANITIVTWVVTSVIPNGSNIWNFTITVSVNDNSSSRERYYACDGTGIFQTSGDGSNREMILPPEGELITNNYWNYQPVEYGWANVDGFESIELNGGVVNAAIISVSRAAGAYTTFYAPNSGPIRIYEYYEIGKRTLELANSQPKNTTFDEANVRYILADIQLGDVADYYRQFTDQSDIAEALLRWDAGYRVTNISQFERKVVGGQGWKVVYAGTDTPINGMDVIISSGGFTNEIPQMQNSDPENDWVYGIAGPSYTDIKWAKVEPADNGKIRLSAQLMADIPSNPGQYIGFVWGIDADNNPATGYNSYAFSNDIGVDYLYRLAYSDGVWTGWLDKAGANGVADWGIPGIPFSISGNYVEMIGSLADIGNPTNGINWTFHTLNPSTYLDVAPNTGHTSYP